MRFLGPLAILLSLFAGPADAQTPEETARIEWTLERGRLLFELDRAAWVATDDLFEHLRDASEQGLRGYVVERDGGDFVVTFYGGPENAPFAAYRGLVRNRQVVSREVFPAHSRPLLTSQQRRLARVRDLAPRLDRQPCAAAPFNTVVIPPNGPEDPVDLYLLTPQTRVGEYPFGGHYRATISPAGDILSQRAFTNACLPMRAPPSDQQRPASLFVTHLLDSLPTELHVFFSIWIDLPVAVGIGENRQLWLVTSNDMSLLPPEVGANLD